MEVLHRDEQCLLWIARLAADARANDVLCSAGSILAVAGMVNAVMTPDTDLTNGLTVDAASYRGLIEQHLVTEYIKADTSGGVSVRYNLVPCPHRTGVAQIGTSMPTSGKETRH